MCELNHLPSLISPNFFFNLCIDLSDKKRKTDAFCYFLVNQIWLKMLVWGTPKFLKDIMRENKYLVVVVMKKELDGFTNNAHSREFINFIGVFMELFLTVFTVPLQCWCWTHRLLYCDWYHARHGRKGRRCGYLQLCQSITVPSHQHGTDRGIVVFLQSTWCFLKYAWSEFHCY